MSLLPQQIPPETVPIGAVQPNGSVRLEHNWWLFLYNLFLNVLGNGAPGSFPADALIDLASADADAIDADAIALRLPVANLLEQALQPSDVIVSSDDLPDISMALLLAQDGILPDPPSAAQPVASITVGASPFTYTAPHAGTVAVTGGTVSAIAFIRQGATVATGMTVGLIPVSRGDQVKVTFTAAPTMTFVPWSSQ